jgi:arylsulfatase A-like enzyme
MGGDQPAVCVPSRAVLMTGQSLFHASAATAPKQAERARELMPAHFAKHDHASFGVGKWHNGPRLYNEAFQNGARVFFGGMADQYRTPLHEYRNAHVGVNGVNPKTEPRRKDALCSEWRQNGEDGKVASAHRGVQAASRRAHEDE